MDRIIVVYGPGSTGKTTVINDIYDNLIKKGATVTKSKKKVGGNPIDFEAVLSFKGKTVAFLSMGDYRTEVDKHVSIYKKYDVFITALNTRFSSISTVWLQNSNIIYKVAKTDANNADNQKVLNNVISLI